MVIAITIPKLKKHKLILVAPLISSMTHKRPISWKHYLINLEHLHLLHPYQKDWDMNRVNEIMQKYYPGSYTVVEKYIPSRQLFGFVLEFSDPKEETMWLLKWN